MQLIQKQIFNNFLNYSRLRNNSILNIKRFVRKVALKEKKDDNKIIQVVKKKVDLEDYLSKTSPLSILSIKQDPNLMNKYLDKDLVNKKGQVEIEDVQFKSDVSIEIEEKLNEALPKQKSFMDYLSIETIDVSEDPSIPVSKISCNGCGAKLHCQDKTKEGFMQADIFKSLEASELKCYICYRCEIIKRKNKFLDVKTKPINYDKFILNKILSQKKAHVVLLVDLLDLPNSIYDGWSRLIKTRNKSSNQENEQTNDNDIDICIIGNKLDLLPNTGPIYIKSIMECLLQCCADKGIKGEQIKYVELISAKTGYNVEKVISRFFKLWNDEFDVYLLGMANAGKSVLFNQFLNSDFCRTEASDALIRATTSYWPGTTLNVLKFPITFLTDNKRKIRKQRLLEDVENIEKVDWERVDVYNKTKNLKYTEYFGIVRPSFKQTPGYKEVNVDVDSTYSIDQESGLIKEGVNYTKSYRIEKEKMDKARRTYDHGKYKNKSAWFYDTPGVLGDQEILK